MNQKNKTYNIENELPEIILIGINHKTAPLEIRERFSFSEEKLEQFIATASDTCVEEIVYISTCNRVSIYFTAHSFHKSIQNMLSLLSEFSSLPQETIEPLIYKKYNKDAIKHLFSVISSLDSMVLGENEIFGQVKDGYRTCVDFKSTGVILNRLFHHAFNTGKRVRTETDISKNPVSIAYIATEKAKQALTNLQDKKVLLIGAGEMGELILKYISKSDIETLYLANRSVDKAEMLAQEIHQEMTICPLEDVPLILPDIDIVISSVTIKDYLITSGLVKEMMKKREHAPLVCIDIGVPRNIDPAISTIPNVHVFNIDDLEQTAQNNIQNRLNSIDEANVIIAEECDNFIDWLSSLEIAPMINKLHSKFDEVRLQELQKYRRRKLKHLSPEDFALVEELTRQIMTKTLHNPIMAIKNYQQETSKQHIDLESIIEELFHK